MSGDGELDVDSGIDIGQATELLAVDEVGGDRAEYRSRIAAGLWAATWWRSITRKGTTPEPPGTSSTGPARARSHTR